MNSKYPVDTLKELENKPLLFDRGNDIIMFTDVGIVLVDEKYGFLKDKTRKVDYLQCKLYGYDRKFAQVYEHTEEYVKTVLTLFNINQMRKNYLDHLNKLDAMQEFEKKLNEPSYMENVLAFLKENKLLSATKEYKQATNKSLQESKNDVLEIFEKHYPEQYKNFIS
jgi:hypothetical protein